MPSQKRVSQFGTLLVKEKCVTLHDSRQYSSVWFKRFQDHSSSHYKVLYRFYYLSNLLYQVTTVMVAWRVASTRFERNTFQCTESTTTSVIFQYTPKYLQIICVHSSIQDSDMRGYCALKLQQAYRSTIEYFASEGDTAILKICQTPWGLLAQVIQFYIS